MKFHQIWQRFTFLHICFVEKNEIPLHVEKFHVLKTEISPHGRFLFHLHVGDRGDKYEVWLKGMLVRRSPTHPVVSPWSTTTAPIGVIPLPPTVDD